jgi:hypothetical protein
MMSQSVEDVAWIKAEEVTWTTAAEVQMRGYVLGFELVLNEKLPRLPKEYVAQMWFQFVDPTAGAMNLRPDLEGYHHFNFFRAVDTHGEKNRCHGYCEPVAHPIVIDRKARVSLYHGMDRLWGINEAAQLLDNAVTD